MDEKIIDELETLFGFVPPDRLREQITMIYFQYLQGEAIKVETEENFKALAEDVYFLIRFLELSEKLLVSK